MKLLGDSGLGILALALYILGGVGTFSGIGMIALIGESDLLGLGSGKSLGYLFLCVGVAISILGVLMMRVYRNHFAVPQKNA
jgi:hypothetical protein